MKPGQNVKQRLRGRNTSGANKGRLPSRNTTFDSNGPEVRVRGNVHQVLEKYLGLARDATSQGDRIAAENYYQHAEHYFRLINNQNQHNGNRGQAPRQPITPADDQGLYPGDLDCDGENGDDTGSADSDEETEGGESLQDEAVRA